jgi:hypothetical protein
VVADDLEGVRLVAAPAQPTLADTYVPTGAVSGPVNDCVVQGGIAYLAVESSGVDVVDVSDPTDPQRIGSWTGGSLNLEIAVQGNLALMPAYYGGFYLLDVSNPNPVYTKHIGTGQGSRAVAVSGDRAYFTEYNLLRILDIAQPATASVIGTHIAPDYGEGLSAYGSMVYAADQDSGLQFVDASNPTEPLLSGYYTGNVYMEALAEEDGYLYAVDSYGGGRLFVFDVRTPAQPTPPLATLTVGGSPSDVCVAGGFAFVVGGTGGLKVVDVKDPAQPRLVTSSTEPSNSAQAVASEGQYVYVADDSNGLLIIDLLMGY